MLITSGLAFLMSAAQADTGYEFRAVDFPGSANTAIYAVNNLGQFVGAEKDTAGAHHAIFDDGIHLRLLDPRHLGLRGLGRATGEREGDDGDEEGDAAHAGFSVS